MFNILAAISLAMFFATMALWVRGSLADRRLGLRIGRWDLYSDHGQVMLFIRPALDFMSTGPFGRDFVFPGFSCRTVRVFFDYTMLPNVQGYLMTTITVHDAWILTLTAAPPVFWLWRHRHARQKENRRQLGLCLHCGYDLRAHTPGERCPECGMAVANTAT